MDNSLKTKEKPPKRGTSAQGKTKTIIISKELKIKDLHHTAAERASEPPTQTQTQTQTQTPG